jgi:hypothetical protein
MTKKQTVAVDPRKYDWDQAKSKWVSDTTEYCEECRCYHERPTWAPGRPCSK